MTVTKEIDFLFAEYAIGMLPISAAVLVKSHLEICKNNQCWVTDLCALGGVLLDGEHAPAKPSAASDINLILDKLGNVASEKTGSENDCAGDLPCSLLPDTLRRYVGCGGDALAWRSLNPGLDEFVIATADGCRASLLRVAAGGAIPSHSHGGREITLVLQGGLRDQMGHYLRGDIAIADEDVDHGPVADEGEDCVCFAVSESHRE